MNSRRVYYAMLGIIVILIGAIVGGTYLANLQLQKQSAKLVEYKTLDQVLGQQQTGLNKAKQDVVTYSELQKIIQVIVPQDKDQAQAVREIINIAAASGIKPTGITFPASTLGNGVISSAGASPSSATSGAAGSKQALSQLTPVKGITGLYNIQITVQQDSAAPVPYSKFIDFLSRLEQNRRTAQVTGIVIQPDIQNRNLVSFTLTVNEYIKP